MEEDSIEEQKIQQAKNNILRGEDIDSATYILEKVIFDNVFFIGGRVNPLKVATRQVINFIKRYQKSDYETICLENNELKEKNERLESENQEFLYKYGNILKENETLKKLHIQDNNKLDFVMKHCILEQKIKDKIEELNKKEQKLQNSISAEEREEYSDANISWDLMDINIKREVLQDLIEGRK